MASLSTHSISKSYDQDQPVVNNISLEVKEGEILAIIGPSGSGKTTLIKMLAGLIQPDQGEIRFHDQPLEGPDDKLVPGHKEIRLVHQDFKLHHRMTVAENLNNALLEYIPAYRKERTAELMELCGISKISKQFVHEISGGEKQRVAIAMALATEPEVLLFDEPFSNLDLITKHTLLQELSQLSKRTNTAIIMITHDGRDAMEIADRLAVLYQGNLIHQGSPKNVYRSPKYQVVASLLGFYNYFQDGKVNGLGLDKSIKNWGIWAEDVILHQGDLTGKIKKIISVGPYNKVLIQGKNMQLWALDFSKDLQQNEPVNYTIRKEAVFELAEHKI